MSERRSTEAPEYVPNTFQTSALSTPVAVIGTLAEFRGEPLPYDLGALVDLVMEAQPDLLCLDLTPEQWRKGDFEELAPEYKEALLPLSERTDIVVVPVAGASPPEEPAPSGWRARHRDLEALADPPPKDGSGSGGDKRGAAPLLG